VVSTVLEALSKLTADRQMTGENLAVHSKDIFNRQWLSKWPARCGVRNQKTTLNADKVTKTSYQLVTKTCYDFYAWYFFCWQSYYVTHNLNTSNKSTIFFNFLTDSQFDSQSVKKNILNFLVVSCVTTIWRESHTVNLLVSWHYSI